MESSGQVRTLPERRVLGFFAAVSLVALIVGFIQPISNELTLFALLLLELPLGGVGMAGAWRRSNKSTGSVRLGWRCLTMCFVFMELALLTTAGYEGVTGQVVGIPAPPDLLWFTSYGFGIAGTVLVGSGRSTTWSKTQIALDGAIVATSVLFVSWALVLQPEFARHAQLNLRNLTLMTYPVLDVIVATTGLVVLRRCAAADKAMVSFVAAGAFLMGLADSVGAATDYNNTVTPISAAIYVAAAALIAASAWVPISSARAELAAKPIGVGWSLFPYIPTVAALATAGWMSVAGRMFSPFLGAIGVAIAVCVCARQLMALLDNVALTHNLADAVEQLKMSQAELQYQAFNDPLTNLFNRRYLERYVESSDLSEAGEQLAVLFVDLNDFKEVNDHYGHETGDLLLIEVARRLQGAVRSNDLVVRLGGDEFAIVVREVRDRAEVEQLADRVSSVIREVIVLQDAELHISGSVGLAIGEGSQGFGEVMRRADVAMYAAKRRHIETYARFDDYLDSQFPTANA